MTKEFSDQVWTYAEQIGNHHGVTRIKPEDRALVPEIVEILEAERFFKCLTAKGGVALSLRAFAANEPEFTTPTGRKWKPGITAAADCPDTPDGYMEAVKLMARKLPYTLVLLVEASESSDELIQRFASVNLDARLVILE